MQCQINAGGSIFNYISEVTHGELTIGVSIALLYNRSSHRKSIHQLTLIIGLMGHSPYKIKHTDNIIYLYSYTVANRVEVWWTISLYISAMIRRTFHTLYY